MGLTVSEAPPSEYFAEEALRPSPKLEYYPGKDVVPFASTPILKLSIKWRNHAPFTGPTKGIIAGYLTVFGHEISNGKGWRFTFDKVWFTEGAADTVWTLKAQLYNHGKLVDCVDVGSVLVNKAPQL